MNASEAHATDSLLTLAHRLTDQAGFGRARGLSRLAGGKNNQVYRVDTEGGVPLLLKRYFSDPRDARDRLSAEWNFLERVWQDGVRAIPQPLAKDADARAALHGFVAGRKLDAGELENRHIDAAADFILAINAKRHAELDAASDACFSVSDRSARSRLDSSILPLKTCSASAMSAISSEPLVAISTSRSPAAMDFMLFWRRTRRRTTPRPA